MKINKPYIIAETAYNHQGELEYLKKMIEEISSVELDAVKFHLLLNPESYMQKKHPLIEVLKDWIYTREQWCEIFDFSLKNNLDIVALCDDIESLIFINQFYPNIFGIEIHASSLNDIYILKEACNFSGKIILGIGGSEIDEIEFAYNFLKAHNKNDILLMYGFQSYPTKYSDINLSKILKIQNLFNVEVGYADHTAYNDSNNEILSSMAAMMGINILEKHYTVDFGTERIDYHAAVGKNQIKKIKELMTIVLEAYGDGNIRMSVPELNYGNTGPMKKAIVAKKKIKKGEILTFENLWFKRTEESTPIKQKMFANLIGLAAIKDIEPDEIIDFTKIDYEFKKISLNEFTNIK